MAELKNEKKQLVLDRAYTYKHHSGPNADEPVDPTYFKLYEEWMERRELERAGGATEEKSQLDENKNQIETRKAFGKKFNLGNESTQSDADSCATVKGNRTKKAVKQNDDGKDPAIERMKCEIRSE